jgi:hypothetical protein
MDVITGILQECNRSATSMQVHYHYMHTFIDVFCYGTGSNINRYICRQTSTNLDSCIELAARLAEGAYRRVQEVYANIYPNE